MRSIMKPLLSYMMLGMCSEGVFPGFPRKDNEWKFGCWWWRRWESCLSLNFGDFVGVLIDRGGLLISSYNFLGTLIVIRALSIDSCDFVGMLIDRRDLSISSRKYAATVIDRRALLPSPDKIMALISASCSASSSAAFSPEINSEDSAFRFQVDSFL